MGIAVYFLLDENWDCDEAVKNHMGIYEFGGYFLTKFLDLLRLENQKH